MHRPSSTGSKYIVHVVPNQVDVVSEFTYLGTCTTHDGSRESEVLRRIGTGALLRFCRCRCKNFHKGPDLLFSVRMDGSVTIRYFSKQGPVAAGARGALHRLHLC